jgi:hypothetical protein
MCAATTGPRGLATSPFRPVALPLPGDNGGVLEQLRLSQLGI